MYGSPLGPCALPNRASPLRPCAIPYRATSHFQIVPLPNLLLPNCTIYCQIVPLPNCAAHPSHRCDFIRGLIHGGRPHHPFARVSRACAVSASSRLHEPPQRAVSGVIVYREESRGLQAMASPLSSHSGDDSEEPALSRDQGMFCIAQ